MSNNKMSELMTMLGESVSENFSPTLRAKLVSVDTKRAVCTMEVISSPYVSMVQGGLLNNDKVGMRYKAPVYRIWNAFFF
jgi:hypothetical protein